MRSLFVAGIVSLLSILPVAAQERIWIDTDISSGKLFGDMDDALALIMLLRDSTVQIEGISVVHGVRHAKKVTRKLLSWYAPDRSLAVYSGADSHRAFGKRTEAIAAMEAALEEGPLHILALGPATNLATLLQLRPDLLPNVSRISFCAGRRPGMAFIPEGGRVRFTDYNFEHDTVAGRMLLEQGVPLILAGYDCSDSLFISKADYQHLRSSDNAGDRWMYRKLTSWERVWRNFFGVKGGFIPFDVATVAALLYQEDVQMESTAAWVMMGPDDRTRASNPAAKSYLLVHPDTSGVAADYCYHSMPALRDRLLKALNTPGK